ncbi:hypothetical protein M3204_23400 [Mesobacillus subterraneus]|uniref:hypothetical protein n=1 Tax=Mesobacillus subterraneus TaxID=285983 RepID=UPI00203D7558|nr:hypothetical protein [Mesobacillus subterraneus]MCM3667324.1 hypothetical protein [Mesobacillus subterraneus]MCM3686343.1 hypothetical protein [Mesobacillus subterraneus]
MDYIYIDEKGPQETIRMTAPYDEEKKIKLGNDNMYVYVANLIKIKEECLHEIEEKYEILERDYMSSRNFLDNKKELKGKDILGKNFKYGIASLKGRELDFYNSLFDLLLENQVDNLLLSINKISLVADNRLSDWILKMEEKRFIESPKLLKYSIVKYLEKESSKSVIQSFFDSNKGNREVLTEIQKDMKAFVEKNQDIQRMKVQIQDYKNIIQTIKKTKHFIQETPFAVVSFDWNKVSFDLDLWISEMSLANKINIQSSELILDEGIPSEPFKKLNFPLINENEDSVNHVGLRISDVLVVISGKYISKLATDVKYDKNNPEKRKLLSKDWFQLDEEQFALLKKMTKYFFSHDSTYCFIVDTYFDDALLFETYLRYISSYETFNDFKGHLEAHVDQHFEYLAGKFRSKYELALENDIVARKIYGSMLSGIKAGIVRPI